MSGSYRVESKVFKERKPRINTCGNCGAEIDAGRILCLDCSDPYLYVEHEGHADCVRDIQQEGLCGQGDAPSADEN